MELPGTELMATGFDMAGYLAGLPYGKGDLIRGELEVRCPLCGRWEKASLSEKSLNMESNEFGNKVLVADITAYTGDHRNCTPPTVTITFHEE